MPHGSIYIKVRHLTNYIENMYIYDEVIAGNKENSGEQLLGNGVGLKGPTGMPDNGSILLVFVCVWDWRVSVYVCGDQRH